MEQTSHKSPTRKIALRDDDETTRSLERSLRPLYLVSHYGCFLFDWCRLMSIKNRLIVLAARIIGFASLSLMVAMCLFQLVQLWLEIIKTSSNNYTVIPNLIWFCNFPCAIATAVVFFSRSQDILAFFVRWNQLELQLEMEPKRSSFRKLYYFVYGSYAFISIDLIIAICAIMWNRMDASYLLSHYQIFRDNFPEFVIMFFHLASAISMWFFVILSDLVPAWTFYHASLALHSLTLKVEQRPGGCGILQLRYLYDMVSGLVERANDLFSWLMIVDHAGLFFMICAQCYTVCSSFREMNWSTWGYFSGAFIFSFRLLTSIAMASKLHSSYDRMKLAVCIALTSEKISRDDCRRLKLFLIRMKANALAARPLQMYKITPSTLTTIISLTLTYTIVLLQSK